MKVKRNDKKIEKPIITTGDWDGIPIWRYKTMGEILADKIKGDDYRKNK